MSKEISQAVIRRLPRYYRYLGELLDDRQITEVKVTGEISDEEKFSGTFSGVVNNDTLLTVEVDEDFSVHVTSNIDTAY